MSIKNVKDQFSEEIDVYFKDNEIPDELKNDEYNDLIALGRSLSAKDFSENSDKDAVLKKVKNNIETKGDYVMKRTGKIKRITVTAASLTLVLIALMQTAFATGFAQEIITKVKNSISLGNISAVQVEHIQAEPYSIPDELKGKIFDKNGQPIKEFSTENAGEYYTADGEKIVGNINGEIVTEAQKAKMDKERKLIVEDSAKLNDYTCFNVILPSYLPEGYKFDRAEFYKDNEGNVKQTKYVDLYFTNESSGKYIFMQQRFSDEETRYIVSTDGTIEKIKINDADAIIHDNKNIDWEYNGILYGLHGRESIDKSELIKIAESIK